MLKGGLNTRLLFGILASCGCSFTRSNASNVMSKMIRGNFAIEARTIRLLRSAMATARSNDRRGRYEFRVDSFVEFVGWDCGVRV